MLLFTGALTSKPYAFTSRPWELRSVQSVDILDGVGSNIRIDFKESEIVRVLPRNNSDINENWISDKIRFFYDGLKRQRLNNPYTKVNGELKPFKWSKTLSKISSLLKVYSFEYGPSKIGVISGASLDTESLYAVKDLASNYGFLNLGLDSNLKVKLDSPVDYQFQNKFKDLEAVDYCLLIGTNPRFEASLLNLRLRKIFKRRNLSVGSVGGTFNTIFPIDYLSLSSTSLISIAEGKHPVCKELTKAKNPIIIYGSKILGRVDGACIQNVFKLISSSFCTLFKKNFKYNLLHTDSNLVGGFELGLEPFKADDLKNLKIIYSIGVDNPTVLEEFKKLTFSTVLLLQSCTGNRTTNFADIVLPSTSFVEHSGVYYNMEGRPQKTQRAFVGPNLARDNWKIIRVVYQILNKSSLYNTKAQLSTLISKILPSYYFADSWFVKSTSTLSMGYTLGQLYPEKLIKSSFKLFIEDFFMTNDLCQSSKVMAKASESLRSYSTNYKFLDNISRRN